MDDAYLLLPPILIAVVVLLLAFAGCESEPAAVTPTDVLLFVDFPHRQVTVSEATLTIRWRRRGVSVSPEIGSGITSRADAFDRGEERPVVRGTGLNVFHRWDPGICRLTFVNVPVRSTDTWEVDCRLSAAIVSPAAPRIFNATRYAAFTSARDPVTVRFRVTEDRGEFFFS